MSISVNVIFTHWTNYGLEVELVNGSNGMTFQRNVLNISVKSENNALVIICVHSVWYDRTMFSPGTSNGMLIGLPK